MAICRWSTVCENKHHSDLYIYEHADGFISVNIAQRRIKGVENYEPRYRQDDYVSKMKDRKAWIDKNCKEYLPIELPYVGETFKFTNIGECIEFLRKLRNIGYNIPDHAFDRNMYEEL